VREVRIVIKIRYADLPAGIHVQTEASGRDIIIYLLPGLTAGQRRTALRWTRSGARIGHGPALPALGLARAIAADRARMMARNAVAAVRMHPALFVPPLIVLVSAVLAYGMTTVVSIKIQSPQAEPGLTPAATGPSAASGPARPGDRGPGSAGRTLPAVPPDRAGRPRPGTPRSSQPMPSTSPAPSPRRSVSVTPIPTERPAPSDSPTRTATPTATPRTSAPETPSPAPSGSTSPATGRPGSANGTCLNIGPLGVCLEL